MSGAEDKVAQAKARAAAARARLDGSLADLRERVDPRTLAKHATDGLREQGEAAVAVARRNPGIAIGAAAAAGLLLIRRPVLALLRRRSKTSDTHTTRKGAKGNPQ